MVIFPIHKETYTSAESATFGDRRSTVGFEVTSAASATFGDRRSTVGFEVTSAESLTFGDRRSAVGFEVTVRGDRSMETRGLGNGDGVSDSDFVTPRLTLLILGVAGVTLLLGVSDNPDLCKFQKRHKFKCRNWKCNTIQMDLG